MTGNAKFVLIARSRSESRKSISTRSCHGGRHTRSGIKDELPAPIMVPDDPTAMQLKHSKRGSPSMAFESRLTGRKPAKRERARPQLPKRRIGRKSPPIWDFKGKISEKFQKASVPYQDTCVRFVGGFNR